MGSTCGTEGFREQDPCPQAALPTSPSVGRRTRSNAEGGVVTAPMVAPALFRYRIVRREDFQQIVGDRKRQHRGKEPTAGTDNGERSRDGAESVEIHCDPLSRGRQHGYVHPAHGSESFAY